MMNCFRVLILLLIIKRSRIFCKLIQFSYRSRFEVCEFPSIYRDRLIKQCQLSRAGYWWCFRDENVDVHNQKTICPNTSMTYAGNDPGRLCHIPFQYKGTLYYACIRSIDEVNYKVYWWCSTTPNYDNDYKHRWTRCHENSNQLPCFFSNASDVSATGINSECRLFNNKWVCNTERKEIRECPNTETTYGGNSPGEQCHFPFLFGQSEYRSCISAKRGADHQPYRDASQFEPYLWCATTSNYNVDRKWTKCIGEESVLRWSDKRVLIPVLVVLGSLALVLLLAAVLYFFCEGGRHHKRDMWAHQPQYISHPAMSNYQATPSAPPSYLEAVMTLTSDT